MQATATAGWTQKHRGAYTLKQLPAGAADLSTPVHAEVSEA
jgi:hypothetical protein